jgi:hypothetical protein
MQNLRILKFGGSVPRDFFLSGFHSKLSQLEEIVNPTTVYDVYKRLHKSVIDALAGRAITIWINNPQDLILPIISFPDTGVSLVCEGQHIRFLEILSFNKMPVLFSGGYIKPLTRLEIGIISRSSEGVTRIFHECHSCVFDSKCRISGSTISSFEWWESVTEPRVEIDLCHDEEAYMSDKHSNCRELQIYGQPGSVSIHLHKLEKLDTEYAPASGAIHITSCSNDISVNSKEKCGIHFGMVSNLRKVTVCAGITSFYTHLMNDIIVEFADGMDAFRISGYSWIKDFTLKGCMPKALTIGKIGVIYARRDGDDTWYALDKDADPPEGFTADFPPPGTEVRVARLMFASDWR